MSGGRVKKGEEGEEDDEGEKGEEGEEGMVISSMPSFTTLTVHILIV